MSHPNSVRLLVVDDEDSIREVLTDFLTMEGYRVVSVSNGEEAVERLTHEDFNAVLLDMKMPGMNGLELLERIQTLAPRAFSIMMTGYGTVETAIQAMKAGAYDYVLKPFKVQDVIHLVERGLEKQRLEAENIQLKEAVKLYDLSEEMASTLALDRVYDILIDTARDEIDADGVGLWRISQGEAPHCERRWMRSALEAAHQQIMADVDVAELARRADDGEPLILHGDEARQLVAGDDHDARLFSLLCVPLRIKNQTLGFFLAFAFDRKRAFTEGKRKMLAILCGRASAAIENARLFGDLQSQFKETIQAFANLLEDKDPYTRGHSDRVGKYAVMIARELGLPEADVDRIADAALMHDIGKLGIRYEDLNKAEPLTEGEYEMFKSHTTRGKWILEPITFLHDLIPGVYHHHERWDGKGYPLGLAGHDIPLDARILAIADTYDAMTSHRAYRRALPHDVALREIQAFAGLQFDPELVEAFVAAVAGDHDVQQAKAARWKHLEEDSLSLVAASEADDELMPAAATGS